MVCGQKQGFHSPKRLTSAPPCRNRWNIMSSEKAKSDQKAERLAQALRANLRRRKAQARGDAAASPAAGSADEMASRADRDPGGAMGDAGTEREETE